MELVSRGPGRPQYENDTGGCGTLFLMGGEGRANLQLSMSRGGYKLLTSIRVAVMSFKEWSQKLLVKACFFFFLFKNWYSVHVPLKGENEWDSSKNEILIIPRTVCENYNEQPHYLQSEVTTFVSIPHKVALHGT